MTPDQINELHRRICDCILEKFMAQLKPWCEQIKLLLDGEQDLARRVEVLERQMAAMQERHENDMNILLRDALVKGDPVNNPFHSISTR